MSHLAQYIEAAERDNTRRSYALAICHFERAQQPSQLVCSPVNRVAMSCAAEALQGNWH
ncbi:MAG: hypothetical protein V4563_17940 [Pseudomonadota bacterium]